MFSHVRELQHDGADSVSNDAIRLSRSVGAIIYLCAKLFISFELCYMWLCCNLNLDCILKGCM